ncbi:hypothetical protein [Ruegeria sp. SCP11]|uniref:hypothetical protein n=1 Tax=Ruegeria sp. SCP11 TaxID=3141378 RepID=UPI00333E0642
MMSIFGRPFKYLALMFFALSTAATAEEESIQLLFVQTASGVEIDEYEKTVRLLNADPQTVYFSDRPYRKAGHISMDKYLEAWTEVDGNFGETPPNAALSVFEPGKDQNSLVVLELFEPTIEGEDLIYRYLVLDGELPKGNGPAALFIDTIGPGGGVGRGFHGVGVGRRGPGAAGWAGVATRTGSSDTE